MTNPKNNPEKAVKAPTGVNDDPAPAADDRPQHEDETLGDLVGSRDPETSAPKKK